MATVYDQSMVAYEQRPKEKSVAEEMPGQKGQYPGDKMPQDEGHKPKKMMKAHRRHKEHR